MTVPRAATRTSGAGRADLQGAERGGLRVSPAKVTCSPASSGIRISRYSRMWRAGLSNDMPNTFSMTSWCDRPMPERQPPAAGRLHRQRLGRQHHRMAGVGRDHGRAEVDRGDLARHGGEGGQGVVGEDLARPGHLDPGLGQAGHLGHHVVERPLRVEHHADSHRCLVSGRPGCAPRPGRTGPRGGRADVRHTVPGRRHPGRTGGTAMT